MHSYQQRLVPQPPTRPTTFLTHELKQLTFYLLLQHSAGKQMRRTGARERHGSEDRRDNSNKSSSQPLLIWLDRSVSSNPRLGYIDIDTYR